MCGRFSAHIVPFRLPENANLHDEARLDCSFLPRSNRLITAGNFHKSNHSFTKYCVLDTVCHLLTADKDKPWIL